MIYKLQSENLSGVAHDMGLGRQSSPVNWEKYLYSIEKAKEIAEKNFTEEVKRLNFPTDQKICWSDNHSEGKISTQHLGFVKYHISPIKIEDEEK